MNLDDLTGLIKVWAIDRNLDTADPSKQMLKVVEELGEIAEGLAKGYMDMVEDSIGDEFVTLVVLSMQLNLNFEECVEKAYVEIADRKGKMVNGVFVKESDLQETSQVAGTTREVTNKVDKLYQDGIDNPKTGRKKYQR